MAEPDEPYNATLWAVRNIREITCFRVSVNAAGHITSTSVPDFNRPTPDRNFDAAVRAALRERYGEETDIMVVADGGAGFDYFRREVSAGRHPVPPVHQPGTAQEREGQRGLWDDVSE